MNILFVAPAPPDRPDRDGMTQIAYFLLQELGRRHRITVWTLANTNESLTSIVGTIETRGFNRSASSLGAYYLSRAQLPYFSVRHDQPDLHQALKSIPNGTYDLIVLHTPFMAHYLPDVLNTPVAINVIDALSSWFTQTASRETNWLKRFHLQQEARKALVQEKNLYPRANGLCVVSASDADIIGRSTPPSKIAVFPIGIDCQVFFPPTAAREPATVIFTGIMDYPPNVDAAVWFAHNVWPAIYKKYPSAIFKLVGKNPVPAVKSLERLPGIKVTGRVPSVAEELRRATVAISPLRVGTGFKIKINEALACGTPLVASPISLDGTSAEPNHNCLQAETVEEWITQVEELLDQPAHRQQLSAAAVKFATTRTWPVIAAQYEAWYNKIVHEAK
jgi:polysaccharide biosynthesis protein PslH